MLEDLSINLLANLIWLVLGFIAAFLIRILFVVIPAKRLWKLKNPSKLIICTATTTSHTGNYVRPSTGIGQVRAIAYIITSLNKAYRKVEIRRIMLSSEQIKHEIENDIIILGGVKNNQVTRMFLDKIDGLNIVQQDAEGGIYWQKNNTLYKGVTENDAVKKDFGLIIKMKNPFSTNLSTRLILFVGSHTYGTIAAAKFFCNDYKKIFKTFREKNICALVSCDIVDGYPVSIKLEDHFIFNL